LTASTVAVQTVMATAVSRGY